MLAALLSRPCTITTRTTGETVNDYGDALTSETTTSTVCELQQRQRSEEDELGQVGGSDWLLILPPATVLQLGDAVVVAGDSFEVIGEPWRARNPRTGVASHVEAGLRRTVSTDDPSST